MTTLLEYAREYLDSGERPCSSHTAERLFGAVRCFDRWRGRAVVLDELSVELVDQWLAAELAKGRSPNTADWFRSMTLSVWRAAYFAGVTQAEAPPIKRPRKKSPPKRPAPKPRPAIIEPETRTKLVKAAQLVAEGKTREHVAAVLGVKPHNIRDWQVRHPVLWELATTTATKTVVDMVRRMAGTRAVITDPVGFAEAAYKAERWCRAQGEPLYVDRPEGMTLCRFFEEVYLPRFLGPGMATDETIKNYRVALRQWALLTGDPLLTEITEELLCGYRDALATLPGRFSRFASPNTVRSRLTHILTVLRKAGPQGYRNMGAVGLLERVPYMKLPRAVLREPQTVPEEHLSAVYRAAAEAKIPHCHNIKPAHWWRALIVVAFNTGLRVGTLLSLRWQHVRFHDDVIRIPGEHLKTGKGLTLHMLPIVAEHLRPILGDWERVFPWPYSKEYFRTALHDLQDLAGIPKAEHFGMHRIRKTCATELYAISPKAAMLALGHSKLDMTLAHYVGGRNTVAKAMGELPQPAAFTETVAAGGTTAD